MEIQQKFKFDLPTLVKIGKGVLIAGAGAGAIATLQAIGNADIQSICDTNSMWICNSFIMPFVAFAVPTLINIIKEYIKGA